MLIKGHEPKEAGDRLAAFGGDHVSPERATLKLEEIKWLLERSVRGGKGKRPPPTQETRILE